MSDQYASTSLNPAEMHARDAYRLLLSVVAPRPIAWVSSVGLEGALNLAPYSFFNGVGGSPPTVMISVGQRRGQVKDTLQNVQATGDFVVNLVDESLAEAMNLTSGDWAYGVSEFEQAGLETAASLDVRPPRVKQAKAALECRATQFVPVADTHYTLILGRVVRFHLREGLLRPNGLVDAERLRPIARLGGDEYTTLGRVFEMKRPHV